MASKIKLNSPAGGSVALSVDDKLTADVVQTIPVVIPPPVDTVDLVPTGAIIMWSGSISNIPTGWALCDGKNNTPDLTDRFVMGTKVDADIKKTGGSNDASLVKHNHSFSGTEINGSISFHGQNAAGDGGTALSGMGGVFTGESKQNGYHTNASTKGATSFGNAKLKVTPSGKISEEGADGAGKNAPAYIKLAYIMKL